MLKEQLYQNIEKAISEMNFSAAETLAADALRNFPEESFGYKFLAVALTQRENVPFEAVEMCYVKLIQLNAHDTDSILKYAELKLQQGEQEAAIKAYIEVLTHDIANVSALKALGEYELYSNNFPQQALVYFDAAVANAPQDNDLRCHRAIAFKNSGRTIDALMELNSVINKGYNELAYSTKAKMLGEMQKFEDTLPLLTELAKNAPENFAYAYNLGKNAAQIQDYNLAADAYTKAIKLIENPDADFLAAYAEALLKNNAAAQALEFIQKAIQAEPETIAYQLTEIAALRISGSTDLALIKAEKLLSTAGDLYKNDILIEKAFILASTGQIQDAEKMLLDLRKQSGASVPASYALGQLAFNFEQQSDKAYFYIHAAAIADNKEAKAFIKANLDNYLTSKKAELLKENKVNIAENSTNPVLKQLFGKVWQFEDFRSEKMTDNSEEIKSKIKEQLIKRGFFITEDAFVMNTTVELQVCTYKIRKQHNESVIDLELIPLNGITRLVIRLQNSDKGLIYSKEAGEFILYVQVNSENIDPQLAEAISENYEEGSLDFMGDKADTFKNIALS